MQEISAVIQEIQQGNEHLAKNFDFPERIYPRHFFVCNTQLTGITTTSYIALMPLTKQWTLLIPQQEKVLPPMQDPDQKQTGNHFRRRQNLIHGL